MLCEIRTVINMHVSLWKFANSLISLLLIRWNISYKLYEWIANAVIKKIEKDEVRILW